MVELQQPEEAHAGVVVQAFSVQIVCFDRQPGALPERALTKGALGKPAHDGLIASDRGAKVVQTRMPPRLTESPFASQRGREEGARVPTRPFDGARRNEAGRHEQAGTHQYPEGGGNEAANDCRGHDGHPREIMLTLPIDCRPSQP